MSGLARDFSESAADFTAGTSPRGIFIIYTRLVTRYLHCQRLRFQQHSYNKRRQKSSLEVTPLSYLTFSEFLGSALYFIQRAATTTSIV